MVLYQPESGYCFNSDSVFLYDFIDSFDPKGDMLDVGAGSGIVGLLCAKDNDKIKLEAIEKQEEFLIYALKNAKYNNIEYKLYHGDFVEYDFSKKYDYIISNPPFYHHKSTKSDNEMLFNARYNINLPLDKFFKKVSQVLKPKSHFIFCYDALHFGEICVELAKVKMKVVDVQFVYPKIDRVASIVLVHARNGSNALMKVHEPFISFEGDEFSQKTKKIFEKAGTESIKCQL